VHLSIQYGATRYMSKLGLSSYYTLFYYILYLAGLTHSSTLRIAALNNYVVHALLSLERCWSIITANKSGRLSVARSIDALECDTHAIAGLRQQMENFGPHNADAVLITSILLCYVAGTR